MPKAKTAEERKTREATIRRLSRRGYSRTQIAKKVGVSYDTVKLVLDPVYREAQRRRKTAAPRAKGEGRVPTSRWLIPDDGHIDQVAVEVAVRGTRKVRLTWPEREVAARILVLQGADLGTLKSHLGLSNDDLKPMLTLLGLRVVRGTWGCGPGTLVPE